MNDELVEIAFDVIKGAGQSDTRMPPVKVAGILSGFADNRKGLGC
jgi:hypothetical protein